MNSHISHTGSADESPGAKRHCEDAMVPELSPDDEDTFVLGVIARLGSTEVMLTPEFAGQMYEGKGIPVPAALTRAAKEGER